LREQLPNARMLKYPDELLQGLHAMRLGFDGQAARETAFLKEIAPHIKNYVSDAKLGVVESRILESAERNGCGRSNVVLVALAKLYALKGKNKEKGPDYNAANMVLKVKVPYPDRDIYNVLADLRQVELLARAAFSGLPVALLTGDAGLALLWCGLGIRS